MISSSFKPFTFNCCLKYAKCPILTCKSSANCLDDRRLGKQRVEVVSSVMKVHRVGGGVQLPNRNLISPWFGLIQRHIAPMAMTTQLSVGSLQAIVGNVRLAKIRNVAKGSLKICLNNFVLEDMTLG